MPHRRTAPLVLGALLFAAPLAGQAHPPDTLTVRAERSGYLETSRYDDVLSLLRSLGALSPRLRVTSFGYSFEGRRLPLAVWGGISDATPDSVRAAHATRVLVQAEVHGDEAAGKEAALLLLRDLALGRHPAWADSLVVIVAPVVDADGGERVTLANRSEWNGPLGGVGRSDNAQGLDVDRDFIKLETPEARSLVLLYRRYDPHVVLDLRTDGSGFHAYRITDAPPLAPATDSTLIRFLRRAWLPAVAAEAHAAYGLDVFEAGTVRGAGDDRGWYAPDPRARSAVNYLGLRNRFALGVNAYAYAPFRERILDTLRFLETNLDFIAAHATEIRRLTGEADALPVTGRRLAVRADPERTGQATILMGDVARETNPLTGRARLRGLDASRPTRMALFGAYRGAELETAPREYLVPPGFNDVAERLAAQGIGFRRLEQSTALNVEEFHIDSTRVADTPVDGHRQRSVWGAYHAAARVLPAGTLVVPVDQPLGRLAVYLLEPRSEDGLLDWNVLDAALQAGGVYPILRTPISPAER